MRRLKVVIILTLFVIEGTESFATQLVMIIDKNRVVLAADSIFTDGHGHLKKKDCKIKQSGDENYFYAISGIDKDPEIGFDADSLLERRRKGLHGSESLDDVGTSFQIPLQSELNLIRKEDFELYKRFVLSDNINSLFVVDLDGRKPEGYLKDFEIALGMVVVGHTMGCPEDKRPCIEVSSKPELRTFFLANPKLPTDLRHVVGTINKIMNAAAGLRGTEVGPPYSILAIEPTGARWLDKGMCQDIRKPTPAKRPKAKP